MYRPLSGESRELIQTVSKKAVVASGARIYPAVIQPFVYILPIYKARGITLSQMQTRGLGKGQDITTVKQPVEEFFQGLRHDMLPAAEETIDDAKYLKLYMFDRVLRLELNCEQMSQEIELAYESLGIFVGRQDIGQGGHLQPHVAIGRPDLPIRPVNRAAAMRDVNAVFDEAFSGNPPITLGPIKLNR